MQARVDEWIAAWNAHDPARAARQMAQNGLYEGPGQRMALHPHDLGAAMEAMAALFADYRFEARPAVATAGRAVVEWTMHATNTGPIKAGVAATGRALHANGVDVIRDGDGGFAQVSRYYDQKGMFEALGLQVIVEPYTQGRATYGYSMHVSSGNMERPGVVALTWIRARDEAERDRVRAHSSKIVRDSVAQPGFIGIITGFAGERGFTVTAWEDEAALSRALDQEHARAKQDFRTGELSPGVWTSLWQPLRLNRMWSRCETCGQPNDVSDDARACGQCGATLPPRPTYW